MLRRSLQVNDSRQAERNASAFGSNSLAAYLQAGIGIQEQKRLGLWNKGAASSISPKSFGDTNSLLLPDKARSQSLSLL